MLPDEEITQRIIGAADEVHRTLGPGFLESIHEEALAAEFEGIGLRFARQRSLPVHCRGRRVGEHRLDFLVEERVVVELQAVLHLDPVFFAIVRSYLKAMNLASGLILNFAAMPMEIRRVGREATARQPK